MGTLLPEHAEARWLLGQVYLARGQGAAAETEIERAQKLGRRARRSSVRCCARCCCKSRAPPLEGGQEN